MGSVASRTPGGAPSRAAYAVSLLLAVLTLSATTCVVAAPGTPSGGYPAYVQMIDRLLESMPESLRSAVYDETLLLEAALRPCPSDHVTEHEPPTEDEASASQAKCLLPPSPYTWVLRDVWNRTPKPLPSFGSPFMQLRHIKTITSLGIGRLHRDAELSRQYDALLAVADGSSEGDAEVARLGVSAFEHACQRAIAGNVRYAQRLLHSVMDGTPRDSKQREAIQNVLDVFGQTPFSLPKRSAGWQRGPMHVPADSPPAQSRQVKKPVLARQAPATRRSTLSAPDAPPPASMPLSRRIEGKEGPFKYLDATYFQRRKHDGRESREVTSAVNAQRGWPAFRVRTSAIDADANDNRDHAESVTYNTAFWAIAGVPDIRCRRVYRTGDLVEGSRRMCNPEYALYGDAAAAPAGQQGTRDGLLADLCGSTSNQRGRVERAAKRPRKTRAQHIVGWGSNNEFEWENRLVHLFNAATASDAKYAGMSAAKDDVGASLKKNALDSVTAIDCTVASPRPSQTILRSNIRFGLARVCTDLVLQPPSGTNGDNARIRMSHLKALLKGENGAAGGLDGFVETSRSKTVREASAMDDARGGVVGRGSAADAGLLLIKLDVEGFEHVTFAPWLHDELQDIATLLGANGGARAFADGTHRRDAREGAPEQGQRRGHFAMIDFATEPRFMPVGQLQLEFHRIGHVSASASMYWGRMWSLYTLSHLAGLGLILFDEEKNYIDDCCAEQAFVHYRHYVLSETWAALQDAAAAA